jgi:nucleoid DNA-binding protein
MSKISNNKLIHDIAKATNLKVKDVQAVIVNLKEQVKANTFAGNSTELYGLGIFKPSVIKARKYHNPVTGLQIVKDDRKSLKFSISAGFKANITNS